MADTVPGDTSTTAGVTVGSFVDVTIDTEGDRDWFRVDLVAGHRYTISTGQLGSGGVDTFLRLHNPAGTEIASDDDDGPGTLSEIHFTATSSGTYFVSAGTYADASTGSFRLRVMDSGASGADTIAGDVTTTASIALGGSLTSAIDTVGERDWVAITLTAGQEYLFQTVATGGGGDLDTVIALRDAAGNELGYNDDRVGTYSGLRYTAETSGTFYIDVGAWNNQSAGAYTLQVVTPPPLQVYDNDQIATQLTHGYWNGNSHHFDVAPGGTLTYNVTALTADGQMLAREALALWSDVTGIVFSEVTTVGAQITFDDDEDGAFASASYVGGITSAARVNVSTQWLTNYGTSINGYAFQSYVHEIGHALGLGHAGQYNTTADYPNDASYLNDAWVTTVMSYFDQNENTYFSNLGYTRQYTVSPMVADVVAIQNLYGVTTGTRTGDTVYGFNNTSGRSIYDAVANPTVAYTVFDNGGIDTLDYSGFSQTQIINLMQEQFSSVGTREGNVSIARGTVIENAIGGSGADLMIGNSAGNVLTGNGGNDTLVGLEGNDTLDGGLGNDSLDGGLGNDTYFVGGQGDVIYEAAGGGIDTANSSASYYLWANVENLILSPGTAAQYGVGNDLDNAITGNGGDNLLIGHAGDDVLTGGAGADWLYGQQDDDTLWGGAGTDYLVGEAGNDILHGEDGAGEQDHLYGGDGDDTYYVDAQSDFTYEDAGAGGGTDIVYANIAGGTYYLFANVENLTLQGTTLYGVGNALANTITGSASVNWLLGGDGADVLNGMADNDVLFGEGGADIFVYGPNGGVDTIGDFAAGSDRLDLSAYFTSFAEVQGALGQVAGDSFVTLPGGGMVILQNVAMGQLSAADFILSAAAAAAESDKALILPDMPDKGPPVMDGGKGDAWMFADAVQADALYHLV